MNRTTNIHIGSGCALALIVISMFGATGAFTEPLRSPSSGEVIPSIPFSRSFVFPILSQSYCSSDFCSINLVMNRSYWYTFTNVSADGYPSLVTSCYAQTTEPEKNFSGYIENSTFEVMFAQGVSSLPGGDCAMSTGASNVTALGLYLPTRITTTGFSSQVTVMFTLSWFSPVSPSHNGIGRMAVGVGVDSTFSSVA